MKKIGKTLFVFLVIFFSWFSVANAETYCPEGYTTVVSSNGPNVCPQYANQCCQALVVFGSPGNTCWNKNTTAPAMPLFNCSDIASNAVLVDRITYEAGECDQTKFNKTKSTVMGGPKACLDSGGCVAKAYKIGDVDCWPAGKTTQDVVFACEDPNYPYRYAPSLQRSRWECCENVTGGTCIAATPSCGSLYKLSADGTTCEAVANSKWDRVSTCDDDATVGIQTAIGCVPTGKLEDTVAFILKFALGAAGGVMVLMLIATGYGLLTSQGNPEKLAGARENVVSIFSGLILIVFSLVLLQTIGANILGLPGF